MHFLKSLLETVVIVASFAGAVPLTPTDDVAYTTDLTGSQVNSSSPPLSISPQCVVPDNLPPWWSSDFDGRECGSAILDLFDKQVRYYGDTKFELITPGSGIRPSAQLYFWGPLRWKASKFVPAFVILGELQTYFISALAWQRCNIHAFVTCCPLS